MDTEQAPVAVRQSRTAGVWFEWLDASIHRQILRLRSRYELSMDEFRGLYVSDEQVDRLIDARRRDQPQEDPDLIELRIDEHRRECLSSEGPMRVLSRILGLSPEQSLAVFAAFAPESDLRYHTLYAYLNNDVTRKLPTVDLVSRLSGCPLSDLQPNSFLFDETVMESADDESPTWLAQSLRVSEPVRSFLSGHATGLGETIGTQNSVLVAPAGSDPLDHTRRMARQLEIPLETFIPRGRNLEIEVRKSLLSSRLFGSLLYFDQNTFGLAGQEDPDHPTQRALNLALEAQGRKCFAVSERSPWKEAFERHDYELVRLVPPPPEERRKLWKAALDDSGCRASEDSLDYASQMFALHAHQIATAAKRVARSDKEATPAAIADAARLGSAALERLATKEDLARSWEHLVLPAATLARLREFASDVRNRDKVFREWSFAETSGGKSSLRALFSGGSGTGKTLSASVVARDLGLNLYRIDLAAVVSKYIGETEKNLEKIFQAAEGSNAILFFDEADALFGKRSDIKDAHDRFANIEVAYLLQRMEQYEGVLILATNLSKNIDEAFSRRIHFEIEFPAPDIPARLKLWKVLIPDAAPMGGCVDLEFLARQFAISGGDIRNVALDAAFLAAGEKSKIKMKHLVRAMARQRLKQGKLPSPSEFRQYFGEISAETDRAGETQ